LVLTGRLLLSRTWAERYWCPDAALTSRVFGIGGDPTFGFYSALETYTPPSIDEVYWTTADDTVSLLTVTNFGTKPDTMTVVLTYKGGTLQLPAIPLQPLESTTVNVSDWKRNGRLPADADYGGFRIFGTSATSKLLVKEHVISEQESISAPFYGPGSYVVSSYMESASGSWSYAVGGSDNIHQVMTWDNNATSIDVGGGMYPQYSNVVTVGGQSESYPYWFPLNAQGPGTSRITAASTEYPADSFGDLRQFYAQAQAQVQVPTSLRVVSATSVGCPGSMNYGIRTDVLYQVLDQSRQPLQSAGMTPYEQGTFFTGGNFDQQLGPATAAGGTFHDNPVGVCSSIPIPGLPLTNTQNIRMRVGNTDYPVRSQHYTLSAPAGAAGFGHGTLTNDLNDINVSR
jgi:hypothetical protein